MTTTRIVRRTKVPTYRTGLRVCVDFKSGMSVTGTIVDWTAETLRLTADFNNKVMKISTDRILFVATSA